MNNNFYITHSSPVISNRIARKEDEVRFIEETNGLHDAYLIGVDYHPHIRTNCDLTTMSSEGSYLTLRYLVTSLSDLCIVDLKFEGVMNWKISAGEITGYSLSYHGIFIDFSDLRADGTKLTALAVYWEIVDRPGLRLQRGGTKNSVWYILPHLQCSQVSEIGEDLTKVLLEISKSVENARFYYTDGISQTNLKNSAFTTDRLHSFRFDEVLLAGEDEAFCWYSLHSEDDICEIFSSHSDSLETLSYMVAICDDNGIAFTAELIKRQSYNLIICSNRGDLSGTSFMNKYYLDPHTGYGLEELS